MATTTNYGWDTPDDTDLVKDGALAIRDLGQEIDTSVGEGLLAWQSWAPTLSGGWANGNGTWNARYVQIGKTVHFSAIFTLGTTTTKGTTLGVSLPVTAQSNTATKFLLSMIAGGSYYDGTAQKTSTTGMTLYSSNAGSSTLFRSLITATSPGTWVTGDSFIINGTYEAA